MNRTADEDNWITVHPNDKGPGRPVLIGSNGEIKGGLGGKFNGQKIGEIRKEFSGPASPEKNLTEGMKANSIQERIKESLKKNLGDLENKARHKKETPIKMAEKKVNEVISANNFSPVSKNITKNVLKVLSKELKHSGDSVLLQQLTHQRDVGFGFSGVLRGVF